ncbi:alpha/beta hydrolase [Nonomuraea sp. NPDC046802]|uniref:alpha/beta fold hydrolase n=1 Tax=Nonomuraea sp. NPDC046802 TaxID=3154919 RepID=UPI0033CEF363
MAGTLTPYTTGTVTSADGTTIGYRRLGEGPGLLLVTGGYLTAEHYMELAQALAESFTVYAHDRRGRGLSGPPGEGYRMSAECEDLDAVLAETGARLVFGHSSGGLIALQAALTSPNIDKVAVYEPALSMYGAYDLSWIPRFEREMGRGELAEAMVTFLKGVRADRWTDRLPRRLLVFGLNQYFRRQRRAAGPGEESIPGLIPLQRFDVQIFHEMASSDGFAGLRAELLLMDGDKTPPPVHEAMDALQATVPHAERVVLRGVAHEAPVNGRGSPGRVAAHVREFFDPAGR